MIYERIAPSTFLKPYIESYWMIDSEGDAEIQTQKIIPDGFPEMIIHYGEPYRINLSGSWEVQTSHLLAGQIRNHFYLENTGSSGMIGIKFMPAALTRLFDLDMTQITDRVVSISSLLPGFSEPIKQLKPSLEGKDEFISQVEKILQKYLPANENGEAAIDLAIKHLLTSKGLMSVNALCSKVNKSERQLERLFSRYIGLSPKFYSRIIRLGHIFELMQSEDNSWADLVYQSGFYDQSHFIKNFKEFTGEDPSSYGFDEKNMANFHLRK